MENKRTGALTRGRAGKLSGYKDCVTEMGRTNPLSENYVDSSLLKIRRY